MLALTALSLFLSPFPISTPARPGPRAALQKEPVEDFLARLRSMSGPDWRSVVPGAVLLNDATPADWEAMLTVDDFPGREPWAEGTVNRLCWEDGTIELEASGFDDDDDGYLFSSSLSLYPTEEEALRAYRAAVAFELEHQDDEDTRDDDLLRWGDDSACWIETFRGEPCGVKVVLRSGRRVLEADFDDALFDAVGLEEAPAFLRPICDRMEAYELSCVEFVEGTEADRAAMLNFHDLQRVWKGEPSARHETLMRLRHPDGTRSVEYTSTNKSSNLSSRLDVEENERHARATLRGMFRKAGLGGTLDGRVSWGDESYFFTRAEPDETSYRYAFVARRGVRVMTVQWELGEPASPGEIESMLVPALERMALHSPTGDLDAEDR